MIYRILTSTHGHVEMRSTRDLKWLPYVRFKGAFMAGVDGFDFKAPAVTNERARFYFTEKGWQEYGRHIAASARQDGRVIKVIRRKNPDKSQIIYEDDLQVAILPCKKRKA